MSETIGLRHEHVLKVKKDFCQCARDVWEDGDDCTWCKVARFETAAAAEKWAGHSFYAVWVTMAKKGQQLE